MMVGGKRIFVVPFGHILFSRKTNYSETDD